MSYFNPSQARQDWRTAKADFEAKIQTAKVNTSAEILLSREGRKDLGPLLDSIDSDEKTIARYKESEGQGPKLNAARKIKLEHVTKARAAVATYMKIMEDLRQRKLYPTLDAALKGVQNALMKIWTPLDSEYKELNAALRPR
jgi:hypothetical protein